MAWVIIEGLDRTGKSTLAEFYKKRGYEIVHLSAPDKKYRDSKYVGPSYMDEMIDLYMKYNAMNVVFDRSAYGEFVWPLIYGRKAQLTEEDITALKEIEDSNETTRILMHDTNTAGHWQRCVDNKEPLTKDQFTSANMLFDRFVNKFNFQKMTLNDVMHGNNYVGKELTEEEKKQLENVITASGPTPEGKYLINGKEQDLAKAAADWAAKQQPSKSPEQLKLEKANVINEVLSKRILKGKGPNYDSVEAEIRQHLNTKLGELLGNKQQAPAQKENPRDTLSTDEIRFLKLLIKKSYEEKKR